jgi:hypothetical protein
MESLNTDVTRDRKPCATAIRRTDLCYPSTLRLAELGDALDMRSVGASPTLRLLHPRLYVLVGSQDRPPRSHLG